MATVDVRFMFEVEVAGAITRRMVVPPVSRYALQLQPATEREWTFGTRPVKQKMGFREARISLSGISGGPKRRKGYTSTGVETTLDGRRLFEEFVKFVELFEAEGAETEGPTKRDAGKAPRLIFRSMQDSATAEAWYVEITSFSPVRDTDSARTVRAFTMELVTEGKVQEARAPTFVGTPAQQVSSAALMGAGIDEAVRRGEAARLLREAEEELGRASDGVTITSLADLRDELPARWAAMRGPLDDFLRACQSAKEAAGVVQSYANFPRTVVNAVADAGVTAIETLEAFVDAVPQLDGRDEARDWFVKAYGEIEAVRSTALASLGYAGSRFAASSEDSAGQPPPERLYATASGQPIASATVGQGETLPMFAWRVLGDPSRWEEIMALNGMASPFSAADGSQLIAGLVLRVPAIGGVSATDSPDLLGVDLAFDDGELVLDGTADFALVRGEANLEQALVRRLTSVRGTNLAFPGWGLPPLVGEPALAGSSAYIASALQEQLRRDNRVKGLEAVVVTQSGGAFESEFTIKTVGGGSIPVIAPFPS